MRNLKITTLPINLWAAEDQPRTKMITKGSEVLSDAELLSILIGSGTRNENAVELCRRLLSDANNNLSNLSKMQLSDLINFEGLGTAKAVTILAAFELGRRRQESQAEEKKRISSPIDVYNLFLPLLQDKHVEEFWALYLNQAGRVISKKRISTGGIDGTYADVRLILREAVILESTQIAVVHNHPSGNERPSSQDIHLTKTIKNASEAMNIRLFDHVIVTDGSYYSFADEGVI